jgi:phospholipid transport system transporter-binding protein
LAAVAPAVHFEDLGQGRFRVAGCLSFDTASHALSQSRGLFGVYKKIQLDLSGVEGTDSAGLALLVEWAGWARREKRKLGFKNVPKQVLALARISEVDKILALD